MRSRIQLSSVARQLLFAVFPNQGEDKTIKKGAPNTFMTRQWPAPSAPRISWKAEIIAKTFDVFNFAWREGQVRDRLEMVQASSFCGAIDVPTWTHFCCFDRLSDGRDTEIDLQTAKVIRIEYTVMGYCGQVDRGISGTKFDCQLPLWDS